MTEQELQAIEAEDAAAGHDDVGSLVRHIPSLIAEVRRLRKRLGEDADAPGLLATVFFSEDELRRNQKLSDRVELIGRKVENLTVTVASTAAERFPTHP